MSDNNSIKTDNINNNNDNNEKNKEKKKMSLLTKIIIGLVSVILLLLLVVICYGIHLTSLPKRDNDGTAPSFTTTATAANTPTSSGVDATTSTEETTTEDLSHLPEMTLPTTSEGETTTQKEVNVRDEEGIYNIILLGADPKVGYLTDSMIVVTINQNDNSIKMTSFMRDTFVDIPGHEPNRLNTVYQTGGMNLLKEVFRNSFGIELYGYVMVDYYSLVDVVDALGGIEIYVSKAVAEFLNTSNYIEDEASRNLIPGAKQLLNGYQVVGYCRQRKVGNGYEANDFARTQRQREVLNLIYEKFRDKNLVEILGLMEKLLPLVTTDLSQTDMISMATKAVNGVLKDIEQMRVPIDGSYEDYRYTPPGDGMLPMRVIAIDYEANMKALHEFMFGESEE